MSRVRLVPIIFIVVCSLAILLGGWRAYLHFRLFSPLESQLRKIQGVESVQMKSGTPPEVDVHLKQVTDLQTTYLALTTQINEVFSGSENVVIFDHRNQSLMSVFEDLQPLLGEAMANGNYRAMITASVAEAAKHGVHARITMDQHNFYIQLQTKNHYFYSVYPLHQGGGAA